MNNYSQENYSDALSKYQSILNSKTLSGESEKKLFEKTHFEIGRCFLKMNKLDESLKSFSYMIKTFPNAEQTKNAIYYMGIVYEMKNNIDKAITYYNKVVSLEPKDQINRQANKRLKLLQSKQRKG